MTNSKLFYQNKNQILVDNIKKMQLKLLKYNWLRGLWFVFSIVLSIWAFNKFNSLIGFLISFLSLLILIYFIKSYQKNNTKLLFYEKQSNILLNELKVLEYDFSGNQSGEEFTDTNHDYSYDLDVFGKNSIFQMISRTFSNFGKKTLANYLKKKQNNKSDIIEIQKSVNELTNKIDFGFDYITSVAIAVEEENKTNKTKFEDDLSSLKLDEKYYSFYNNLFSKIILILLPILSISLLILTIFSVIDFKLFFIFSTFMLLIVAPKLKQINEIHNKISSQSKILNKYSILLEKIENQEFTSQHLNNLKTELKYKDTTANKALKDFSNLLNALDNRFNVIFAFTFNSLVLWDIQVVKRIIEWQKNYSQKIDNWFNVIAEFEFLISLSIFKFNNPSFIFPTISDENILKSKNLGHPNIPENVRITNDFTITQNSKSFIITGANMAGKSTFLRTIGVNFILAQIGSVVCANEFDFRPLRILTSIRITDSLSSNESYFYAELKRLSYIINEVENNQNSLVIVDEMLRGTNSKDKHYGSVGLIKKMLQKNVVLFLATHDIALGELEKETNEKVKNFCFEAEISNDELHFDYKLKTGVSKNLNASFLMKKMNIIE